MKKGIEEPKKSHKKRAAVTLLLLLLLFAIAGFLGYKYLRVDTIRVEGNSAVKSEYIVSICGVEKGQHMITLDRDKIKQNIERDPFLTLQNVDIKLPDQITLRVTERKRAAVVLFADKFIVIDKNGYILEIKGEMEDIDYPVISGFNVTAFDLGAKIKSDDSYKLSVMSKILSGLSTYDLSKVIAEIDLSNINSIKLTSREGMNVKFGQSDRISDKLQWVSEVMKVLKKEGKATGTIDVTASEFATYSPPETSSGKEDKKSSQNAG